ncbi:DUF362 domain-containing protein [Geobacter sp. SVR]|uniref:DUF362 domain-containing protein n=1 Tax=Geobacter sp. SVR TaxID=2495594 RepID=UPI00143EFC0D|nr:DUF362 domain-containing protein [Geobacter sp. SVR]BCS54869.1 hypothetical protein GSVR_31770 [Geobacter sp. SVR]GCF87387.1 hypothetical protein GSbR_39870 [Geobacter sp. SVR]
MTMRENVVTLTAQSGAPSYEIAGLTQRVRHMLHEAAPGSHPEAPFSSIIQPGMTVLLKPNWVLHRNYSGQGNDCLVTHPNLIEAVLREVLKAKPGRVIIGDSPIQECDFDALVPHEWRRKMRHLATCPVDIIDFRRTVLRKGGFGEGQEREVRGEERYILFDLGKESLLEPVSTPDSRFRITCYDPDLMARRHLPGKHQYLLAKEPFESDVIINLPKLKSHKKAGMTAALKNMVGINGNKEFLPHHRTGGSADGGDCYPGKSLLKRMAERCYDEANRTIGSPQCERWLKKSGHLLRLQHFMGNPEIEGGWHGNDTVWRMTLDLNRLLLYGRADGTISDTPLRKVYSLTDAIIAGEGEGPLAPRPIPLGILTFAASSVFADLVGAALMHFDYRKIPTLREAFDDFRYPLAEQSRESCRVVCDGKEISPEEAGRLFGKPFAPSAGWLGHIERERSRE